MKSIALKIVMSLGAVLLCVGAARADEAAIDWPSFLARHDLVWKTVPNAEPGRAPFLGDGTMGTMLRQTGPNELSWLVGATEVEDRRDIAFGRSRLPVGDLLLQTAGTITGCDLRLALWNAELAGTVTTSAGEIRLRAIVHATRPVIVVELTPTAGEVGCTWSFRPAQAINPRIRVLLGNPKGDVDDDAIRNAKLRDENVRQLMLACPRYGPAVTADAGDVHTVTQQLQNGAYATAWREQADGPLRRMALTVAYQWGDPATTPVTQAAVTTVRQALSEPADALVNTHRTWWHAYYPKSFLSVADPYWETFYWVHLYKLACVTRAEASVLDNQGPWLLPTPWSGTWWNLNVQLDYQVPYSANHIEDVGDSLRRGLVQHQQSLIETVPESMRADSAAVSRATAHDLMAWSPAKGRLVVEPPEELGNLTWALHCVWVQYRMTMDERMLREDLVPLLRRSVNLYLHHLTKGQDGKLHLPVSTSPEYPKEGADTNYDLSLLRWGLQTLIWADDHLKTYDALRPTWEQTLATLVDYPQDANGFLIAAGVPYGQSHRHYSHLLMIYPLYLVNAENGGRDLIERSVAHWQSLPAALKGYSFTGSAAMYAGMGDGDRALKQLNGLKSFLKPNSMYFESGPVLETPFAACQSIHDMLLQSWPGPRGSVLRIFPAVPSSWPDASFEHWRAEGAFLVSAVRQGGRTRWVKIESLAGEPCRVRPGLGGQPVVRDGPAGVTPVDAGDGVYIMNLKAGQSVILTATGDDTARPPAPVDAPGPRHVFGLPAAAK